MEITFTNISSLVYTCEVKAGNYSIVLKRKLRPRDVNKPTKVRVMKG